MNRPIINFSLPKAKPFIHAFTHTTKTHTYIQALLTHMLVHTNLMYLFTLKLHTQSWLHSKLLPFNNNKNPVIPTAPSLLPLVGNDAADDDDEAGFALLMHFSV